MNKEPAEASDAVVAFLREELKRRYLYDNVRRFKELKDIDEDIVTAFREFALSRIYPEGKARAEIDGAFASLHEMLRSPRKMASLGPIALAAVWRLGRRLPAALSHDTLVIATPGKKLNGILQFSLRATLAWPQRACRKKLPSYGGLASPIQLFCGLIESWHPVCLARV